MNRLSYLQGDLTTSANHVFNSSEFQDQICSKRLFFSPIYNIGILGKGKLKVLDTCYQRERVFSHYRYLCQQRKREKYFILATVLPTGRRHLKVLTDYTNLEN